MDQQLARTISERLRRARDRKGWSQAQAAERAAMAVEAYGRLERGAVLPGAKTIVALVRALGVTSDELLGLSAVSKARPADVRAGAVQQLSRRIRSLLRTAAKLADEMVEVLGK